MYFSPRHQVMIMIMMMSVQIHFPAALPSVSILYKVMWALVPSRRHGE
jgi:hypothetical protein